MAPAGITAQLTPEIIQAFRDIGFAGGTVVAIWALVRGWVVPGGRVDKMERDCRDRIEKIERESAVRIDKLEAKLDQQTDVLRRQTESQGQTIAVLQETLKRIEGQG